MAEKKSEVALSIIIPIFNAEKYVGECLESIFEAIKESEVATEVIAIDNESRDGSISIVQDFANKHKELALRILKCQKCGASAVRNMGAREAKGKYLWFIDADDTIGTSSIRALVDEAEKSDADLVMMGASRVYEDGHTDYLSAVDPSSPDYKSRFVRYGAGPWQFLIRRKWWNENGFCFREGIIHEDMEMVSSLILYTDKFACVDTPLYFYRQTPNSVLHKRSWDKHAYDIFPALEGLYERFKALGAHSEYRDELEWFFVWNLLIDSAKDFARFPEGRDGFKKSRETLKHYFPNWRKNKFLKQKPLKLKLRVLLNYYK